ncbi:hypothetical protein AAC387_Pa08g1512 [Persea americana]
MRLVEAEWAETGRREEGEAGVRGGARQLVAQVETEQHIPWHGGRQARSTEKKREESEGELSRNSPSILFGT